MHPDKAIAASRKQAARHRARYLAAAKRRREANPEKYREAGRKWAAENKDKRRAIRRRSNRRLAQTSPEFRIKARLRSRVRDFVRSRGVRKSARTELLVGCSFSEIVAYIESKFQPGMNWGNMGKNGWDLDHIMPLSLFAVNTMEQQTAAFHYTNLQPLWGRHNAFKSNKYPQPETGYPPVWCDGVLVHPGGGLYQPDFVIAQKPVSTATRRYSLGLRPEAKAAA